MLKKFIQASRRILNVRLKRRRPPDHFARDSRPLRGRGPGAASVPPKTRATLQPGGGLDPWTKCSTLAQEPHILECFAKALATKGVAGEARAAKLLYLTLTTRFLDRPVSAVVKGPSSGGKSFVVMRVLEFCPPRAYYALTGMSEHALAYSEEPLAHRFLVIPEAVGLRGEHASYLVRSLLSDGRVRYETVEKTPNGRLQPRLIERKGPTGLLVTTTAVQLHPENETRLLSIPVTDTPEQTREVLRQLAKDGGGPPAVDFVPWHALQEWLEKAEHRVKIPYAERLAELILPVAVRLRRDFGAILSLITAHTILQQANRARETDGRITATLDDYAVVRELVTDLVAEGLDAAVPDTVRETVDAVTRLSAGNQLVSVTAVAQVLKLDKSAAWRRVDTALELGYLKNLEHRKGRPAQLLVGDPLPTDLDVLPPADDQRLREACNPKTP